MVCVWEWEGPRCWAPVSTKRQCEDFRARVGSQERGQGGFLQTQAQEALVSIGGCYSRDLIVWCPGWVLGVGVCGFGCLIRSLGL